MGSPEFALPSLEAIHQHFKLIAVVTAPDKHAGRGHQLRQTEVKKWALGHNIKVLQPKSLKSEMFIKQLEKMRADLFVVVAFRMLPARLFSLAKYGAVNLHASLLPNYRGAAPIQRAIMAGEIQTGLSVFQLDESIDTGMVLGQCKIGIEPETTGGELHDIMKSEGAKLLVDCLMKIQNGTAIPIPQNHQMVSYAPKIFRDDCRVDCSKPVIEVFNLIRAMIPYPCAWFLFNDLEIKIFKASYQTGSQVNPPGKLFIDGKRLLLSCFGGDIILEKIQPQGKQVISAQDFINGYRTKLTNP